MIEVVVSIGIFSLLLTMSAPFFVGFYKSYQLRSEKNLLLSVLAEARNRSISGQGPTNYNYGVAIDPIEIVLFTAIDALRNPALDEGFARNASISITGSSYSSFLRLSGITSPATYVLTYDNLQETVTINSEGSVDWQ